MPKSQGTLQQDGMPGSDHHVDEPTDWVSSITYIQKENGKLCLCLDPCDLNEAICQDHHKIPTMEEVAHKFTHSCNFTKLDAHHGILVNHPQLGVQPAYNIQHSLQKIPFPATSLWPHLFPRHLPEEDGSDPRREPRMHQNHR